MIRGSFAAAVAAFITVSATAQEPERQFDLRALFERAPGVERAAGDHRATDTPRSIELVIARIGPDGKLIKACVDSEAAARRFFEAPAEDLHAKQAKEQ
jgi:hypothetical protein